MVKRTMGDRISKPSEDSVVANPKPLWVCDGCHQEIQLGELRYKIDSDDLELLDLCPTCRGFVNDVAFAQISSQKVTVRLADDDDDQSNHLRTIEDSITELRQQLSKRNPICFAASMRYWSTASQPTFLPIRQSWFVHAERVARSTSWPLALRRAFFDSESELLPYRAIGTRVDDSLRCTASSRDSDGEQALDSETMLVPQFQWMTYEEFGIAAAGFAAAVIPLIPKREDSSSYVCYENLHISSTAGSQAREMPSVLICGTNCPDWIVADVGCAAAGCTAVILHDAFSDTEIGQVIAAHNPILAVVSPTVLKKIAGVRHPISFGSTTSCLSVVALMNDGTPSLSVTGVIKLTASKLKQDMADTGSGGSEMDAGGLRLCTVEDFVRGGLSLIQKTKGNVETDDGVSRTRLRDLDLDSLSGLSEASYQPESTASIMHTSGSTGLPKGIRLSCAAWAHRCGIVGEHLPLSSSHCSMPYAKSWFSFQPLSHGLDRQAVWKTLFCRGKVGFAGPNRSELLLELAVIAPDTLAATPRFYESLKDNVDADVRRQVLARSSTKAGTLTGDSCVEQQLRKALTEELKSRFGHRLMTVTTGGAMTDPAVYQFLVEIFGAGLVSESYGTTEIGAISWNGLVVDHLDVRIRDVPELGYFTKDGVGEVLVRRKQRQQVMPQPERNVWFSGYHKNEEASQRAFTSDGFYCTGDIGRLEQDSKKSDVLKGSQKMRLTLVDRVKHVFKLSQGEFVAPSKLKVLYATAVPEIKQCFVTGRPDQNNIVAVVVLDTSLSSFRKDSNEVLNLMRVAGHSRGLQPYEIPTAVHIEPDPWIPGNGLTTSLKTARGQLEKRYAPLIDRMYGSRPRISVDQVVEELLGSNPDLEHVATKECRISNGSINDDLTLADLGFDSLAIVEALRRIKESTAAGHSRALELTASDLYGYTIRELRCYLEGEMALPRKAGPDWGALSSFVRRRLVPENLVWDCAAVRKLLVTGATGFVGAPLLLSLLQTFESHRVVCLVRARSKEDGMERLCRALVCTGEIADEATMKKLCSRIDVLPADLSDTNLGIDFTDDDIASALQGVDCIVHNAATVARAKVFSQLAPVNVDAVSAIANLALDIDASLIFISSLSAVSYHPKPKESYQTPWEHLNSLSGYGQTKAIAERLLQNAHDMCGLRCTVLRLGLIGASGRTGYYNKSDVMSAWIAAVCATSAIPSSDETLLTRSMHILPVDICASMISYAVGHRYNRNEMIGWELLHINGEPSDSGYRSLESALLSKAVVRVPCDVWLRKVENVAPRLGTNGFAVALFYGQNRPGPPRTLPSEDSNARAFFSTDCGEQWRRASQIVDRKAYWVQWISRVQSEMKTSTKP